MSALQLPTRILPLTVVTILIVCCNDVLSCSCDVASLHELGIENGHIPDQAMKASSSLDSSHGPGRARLNQGPTGSQGTAWCARTSDAEQFLQIDLIFTSRVTHVASQGMSDPPTAAGGSDITSWVKTYSLEYSSDDVTYNGYYFNKDLKIFDGNDDGASVTCCELPYPIVVRYLRFRPVSWHEKICLRVGVFGKGNVTAHKAITKEEIAVRYYWWWPFLGIFLIFLLSIFVLTIFVYRRIKGRLTLNPKSSMRKKSNKKRLSSFINPMALKSRPQNGHVNIAMETIGGYTEPGDEVQEVVAHFTDDGFSNQHGITHFSVADEDEDEPCNESTRGHEEGVLDYSFPSEIHSTSGASGDIPLRPSRGGSQHLYETVG